MTMMRLTIILGFLCCSTFAMHGVPMETVPKALIPQRTAVSVGPSGLVEEVGKDTDNTDALQYDSDSAIDRQTAAGNVCVKVISATGIHNSDWWGKSDPYVAVTVGGVERVTPTKENSLDPTWNWKKCFQVCADDRKVHFAMKDADVGRDDKLHDGDVDFRDKTNPNVDYTHFNSKLDEGGLMQYQIKFTPKKDFAPECGQHKVSGSTSTGCKCGSSCTASVAPWDRFHDCQFVCDPGRGGYCQGSAWGR